MEAATIERAAINDNFQRGIATVLRLERPRARADSSSGRRPFWPAKSRRSVPIQRLKAVAVGLGWAESPLARGEPDQDRAVIADGHYRGRQQMSQRIRNGRRLAVAPDAHETVGGAEIGADNHDEWRPSFRPVYRWRRATPGIQLIERDITA
jgi:hypothetical protein